MKKLYLIERDDEYGGDLDEFIAGVVSGDDEEDAAKTLSVDHVALGDWKYDREGIKITELRLDQMEKSKVILSYSKSF